MIGGSFCHDEGLAALRASLAGAVAEPSIPHVVVLFGESGRGKTYRVQRLFDELAADSPGYWRPSLTPEWPPEGLRKVNRSRKDVIPKAADRSLTPSFYWVGSGASPVENAIEVEMSPSISDQFVQQLSPVTAAAKRRKSAIVESLQIALDVVGSLLPPVSITKSFIGHTAKISQLAEAPTDPEDARRQALFASFHLASKEQKVPMIVVLDDASAATAESLYLVSGLVSPSAQGLGIDALLGDQVEDVNQFLPLALDKACPAPLLFVCTVWEHRLKGEYQDPFLTWIAEMENLGAVIDWISCEQFSIPMATSILEKVEQRLDQGIRNRILEHITSPEDNGSVNPLVLASVLGQLNEERVLWGQEPELDEEKIASLPRIPEHHTRDRIEEVKNIPGVGALAYRLLASAAHCGQQLPSKMLEILGSRLFDAEIEKVANTLFSSYLWTGVVQPPPTNQYIQSDLIRLDPDVQRFLKVASLPGQVEVALNESCAEFLEWFVNSGLRENIGLFNALGTRTLLFSLAKRVLSSSPTAGPGALAVASAILEYPRSPPGSLAPFRAFGYALGCPWDLDDEEILEATQHFGTSRISALIIQRRLKEVKNIGGLCDETLLQLSGNYGYLRGQRAKALIARSRMKEAVILLEAALETDNQAALMLSDIYIRRGEEGLAVQSLKRGAKRFPHAAGRLAQLLIKRRRFKEAEEILEPYSEEDANGEITLLWAEIQIEKGQLDIGVTALRRGAGKFPLCARRLAQLLVAQGRFSEAVEALTRHTRRDPVVAPLLAEIYAKQGLLDLAVQTLEDNIVHFSYSAVYLAKLLEEQGKYPQAIEVLNPFLHIDQSATLLAADLHLRNNETGLALATLDEALSHFPEAVLRLADLHVRLEQPDSALAVLEPHVERLQDAAILYARIQFSQGRTGDAIERLEPVAPRFKNLAYLLAKTFQWSDPEKSIALLSHWADTDGRSAAHLVRLSLRNGDMQKARQYLRVSQPLNTRKGLGAVIDLLTGGSDQSFNLLQSNSTNTFYILNTVIVNLFECDRPDLVKRLVASVKATEQIDRIVASFMLVHMRRASIPGSQNFNDFIDAIWHTHTRARRAAVALQNTLWLWVRDPDLLPHPLEACQALSILQLLEFLPLEVPERLREIAVDRLKDHAQGVPLVYKIMSGDAAFCPIAVDVLNDVLPPANWTFEFEDVASFPDTLDTEQ